MKKTKINKLNTEANKLAKKISEVTTLIHSNQCNTDKKI